MSGGKVAQIYLYFLHRRNTAFPAVQQRHFLTVLLIETSLETSADYSLRSITLVFLRFRACRVHGGYFKYDRKTPKMIVKLLKNDRKIAQK